MHHLGRTLQGPVEKSAEEARPLPWAYDDKTLQTIFNTKLALEFWTGKRNLDQCSRLADSELDLGRSGLGRA